MKKQHKIEIGEVAGHHFFGRADLQVCYHVTSGSRKGFLFIRKRLRNRKAFEYNPSLGWEVDRWLIWNDERAA